MELFISALGLAMVLEGIPYFTFPGKVKELAKRLPALPNGAIRIFGLSIMALGLVVVYLGRHFFQ